MVKIERIRKQIARSEGIVKLSNEKIKKNEGLRDAQIKRAKCLTLHKSKKATALKLVDTYNDKIDKLYDTIRRHVKRITNLTALIKK